MLRFNHQLNTWQALKRAPNGAYRWNSISVQDARILWDEGYSVMDGANLYHK